MIILSLKNFVSSIKIDYLLVKIKIFLTLGAMSKNKFMSIIAFIPARAGSKRVINKNILNLGGHPLIYHTLKVAKKSKLFNKIFCITDSKKYQNIALKFGSNKFPLRPKKISTSKSPDSAWIKWALKICQNS